MAKCSARKTEWCLSNATNRSFLCIVAIRKYHVIFKPYESTAQYTHSK